MALVLPQVGVLEVVKHTPPLFFDIMCIPRSGSGSDNFITREHLALVPFPIALAYQIAPVERVC